MIIDLNTRIWSSVDQLGREYAERLRQSAAERWEYLDASPAAHERAMSCVSASMVLGFRSERLGGSIPNEYIAEFVSRDPQRRLGAAGVDPMHESALDDVNKAVDLGLVAVTVAPECQGFPRPTRGPLRVYERCAELSLPMFVMHEHPLTPSAVIEFRRPWAWDEVARAFPDWPIVITQLGHPWIDETLMLLGKHDNVYGDISGVASRPWQLYNALLNASSFGVMDKILFGSGFPFEHPAKAIETLYTINAFNHGTQLPSVPRASVRNIVERNSLACLGIDLELPREPIDAEETLPEDGLSLPPMTTPAEPGSEA